MTTHNTANDLVVNLHLQLAFSERTFGPSPPLTACWTTSPRSSAKSRRTPRIWVRGLTVSCPLWTAPDGQVTSLKAIATALAAKQGKNEQRTWPDWRNASPDHAVEHVRVPTPGDTETARWHGNPRRRPSQRARRDRESLVVCSGDYAYEALCPDFGPARERHARPERLRAIAAFFTKALHHPVVYRHPDGWMTYECRIWTNRVDVYFDGPHTGPKFRDAVGYPFAPQSRAPA